MRVRHALLVSLTVALLACGLTVTGELATGEGSTSTPEGGASSGSSGNGNGNDGGGSFDAGPTIACDSGSVPTGVIIVPAGGAACPPGTTEQTVHTDPLPAAGACTCGQCTATAEPSCAGASFVWTWGSSNQCTDGPQSYNVTADNACVTIFPGGNVTLAPYNRWTRTPTPGACTAPTITDDTKVTTTAVRQCVPNAGASLCDVVAGGQRQCVLNTSDGGACAGEYPVAVVVGDGATVTCTQCGCSRTSPACNVEYHDNTSCTSKKYERLADGTCSTTGQPSIRNIKVYPTTPTCTPKPGTPTASLKNQRVLCCTP